jgi:hypothetical protein
MAVRIGDRGKIEKTLYLEVRSTVLGSKKYCTWK